ncbi:FMN-binding negative transcriptional regulator [Nonomuraea sp. NPDC059194]|uniref:FMN-binding negative transcriptional regulator n=1 Tax=Nonomuraea sp. NPDC059194 TaxID=3346764 RepID=UPI0036D1BA9B
MRHNRDYLLDDDERIRSLVRDNPWATLLSGTRDGGLVGSHLPVLLEDGPSLSVVGHLGSPDEELHELGEHEVLLIVAGPHGYVSPGWYGDGGPAVPTYNYLVAHLYGRPEVLDPAETYQVLTETVDRFESVRPTPYRVDDDHGRKVARGVAGFRLRPSRVVAKAKLSQDKPAATAHRIIHALETDATYRNPALAREMRQVWTQEESR